MNFKNIETFLTIAVIALLVKQSNAGRFPIAEADCPKFCPMEDVFTPVCGFDGNNYKLFDTECFLTLQICIDQHDWDEVPMTDCYTKTGNEGKIIHKREVNPQANTEECSEICTQEYSPVCGSNDVQYEIFSNLCELKSRACKTRQMWKQLDDMTPCIKVLVVSNSHDGIPNICPDTFEPICGYDGYNFRLFDNECYFNKFNLVFVPGWTQEHLLMKCFARSQLPIHEDCPEKLKPICGFDGEHFQLFDNECLFRKRQNLDKNIKNWILKDNLMLCLMRA